MRRHTSPAPAVISRNDRSTRLIHVARQGEETDSLAATLFAEEAYYAFFRRLFLRTSKSYLKKQP